MVWEYINTIPINQITSYRWSVWDSTCEYLPCSPVFDASPTPTCCADSFTAPSLRSWHENPQPGTVGHGANKKAKPCWAVPSKKKKFIQVKTHLYKFWLQYVMDLLQGSIGGKIGWELSFKGVIRLPVATEAPRISGNGPKMEGFWTFFQAILGVKLSPYVSRIHTAKFFGEYLRCSLVWYWNPWKWEEVLQNHGTFPIFFCVCSPNCLDVPGS